MTQANIPAGTKVARYSPESTHTMQPWMVYHWAGEVLPVNDIRAWTNTLRFLGTPTQAEVDAHVAWCESQGLLKNDVPVAWEFGKVYWERSDSLQADCPHCHYTANRVLTLVAA